MTLFRRILLVLSLLAPASALAQTEPVGMAPDVIVTADRYPTDPAKVTGSVTVIMNEDMQRRQLRTVADVLRSVPGVSVQQSGGPGTQTSVFVRGANSNHTLVLIDGVNVSDPASGNGAVDFAHFLTENLDRVEVVRGPMSTMYGSQAIGGVINMVTKAGKGPMNGVAFTELGTRLQSNSGAFVRGSEGRFNYNISVAGTYSPNDTIVPARFTAPGGFVDTDPYRNITVASRLGFEINDDTQVTWFSRYIDSQVKFDQVGLEDPNATEFSQQFFNRLEIDGSYFDARWKPTVGISYTSIYRHDQDFPSVQNPFPFTQDSYFNGRRMQADWKNLLAITDQIDFIGGIDFDRMWAYSNADGAQGWGTMSQTGFYGQLRGTFFTNLNLNLAGRVDANDTYGTVTTWRAGASYLFSPTDTKIKGSYGTAFKAPSLFELYGTGFFCAGNRTLQPEYSRGYEFGVEQGLFDRKVTAGITYFFNTYSGLIQCPPPFTSLQNVANAQSEGFETFVQIKPFNWLDFNFEYTHTIARNVDANQPLVRRPQDVFNVRGEVRPWDDVRLGFGVTQVSSRYDFNAATGAIMQPSPYTLLRFTAAYDVRSNVQLFARAENVLNQVYEEPEGFQAPYFQAFFGVKARF
jgi:vitamin B12 transporter